MPPPTPPLSPSFSSFRRLKTNRVHVRVSMRDGSVFKGVMHVLLDERLQDLLNGEKEFFPLQSESDPDKTVLLAKQYIVSVVEYEPEKGAAAEPSPAVAAPRRP